MTIYPAKPCVIRVWPVWRLLVPVVLGLLAAGLVLGWGEAYRVWAAVPSNNNLVAAATISSVPYSTTLAAADVASATMEAGEFGACGSGADSNSVWWKYTPSSAGYLSLNTLNSTYDTVLEVYTGTSASPNVTQLVSVRCNDDASGNLSSIDQLAVTGAVTYYIAVRTYDSTALGNLQLNAEFSTQSTVYVDPARGSDSNPGTYAFPVKTIQRGVNIVAAGGVVNILGRTYNENVTINKSLTLTSTGMVTATSFTLTNGAILGSGTGNVRAPIVVVDQVGAVGAKIQDGIFLATSGGMVDVLNGVYTETVTINKSLSLVGVAGSTVLQPGNPAQNAVNISAGSGAVVVTGFTLQNANAAVYVSGGSGSINVGNNNIITSTIGLDANSAVIAAGNWWGSYTGPTHASNPDGLGVAVSNNVTFSPWCSTPVPGCSPLTGIPVKLAFTTQPTHTASDATMTPFPVVEVQDADGRRALGFNHPVTLTIAPVVPVSGTNPVAAVNGLVTYTVGITTPGTGYVFTATAPGLTSTTSTAFNIYNTAPVANDDLFTVSEDSTLNAMDVLTNDVDADPIYIVAVSPPANGALITSTTLLTYTPNADFNGTDVFTYTITDPYYSGFPVATVTVTVLAVNDAPTNTVSSPQSVNEDTDLSLGGAGWGVRDVDSGGNAISVTLSVDTGVLTVTTPAGGGVSGNGTGTAVVTGTESAIWATLQTIGSLVYRAPLNYNGPATMTMTTNDLGYSGSGGVLSDTDTTAITVIAVNDAPVNAVPVTQTINEDTGLGLGGIGFGVSDVDSGSSAISVTLSVTTGTVTVVLTPGGGGVLGSGTGTVVLTGTASAINTMLQTSGSLTYTPPLNFNGVVVLTQTADDLGYTGSGGALTDVDTMTINVNAVNDPVVAVDDTAGTSEDTAVSIAVLPNDQAANVDVGELLTVTAAGPAGNGVVTVGQILTYTPNSNFNGTDVFTYTVTDGLTNDTATVTVTVSAVNDAPVNAVPVTQTINEDTGLGLGGIGFGVSDVDSGSSAISVTLSVTTGTVTVVLTPGGGGVLGSGTGTVVLTGTASAINTMLQTSGSLTYTPPLNFNGVVVLTQTADDLGYTGSGGALTDVDTMTINVNAVNDPVVAVDDTAGTSEDTAVSIAVLPNDQAANVDVGELLTVTAAGPAGNGVVTMGQILTYTPNSNFNGTDVFTYTVTDGLTNDTATVTVTVSAVNDAPVNAVPVTQTINEDTGLGLGGIGFGVSDVDSGSSAISVTLSVTTGTVTVVLTPGGGGVLGSGTGTVVLTGTASAINTMLQTSGSLTYTPPLNFNGVVVLTQTADDLGYTGSGGALTDVDTMTINVNAVNDPVVAVDDTAGTSEDTAVSIAVLPNDQAANVDVGELLTVTAAGPAGNGVVTVGQILTYTPNSNFNGTDVFTYTVTDGLTNDTATVTVTVSAVNDAPVNAVPVTQTINEDTGLGLGGIGFGVSDVDSGSSAISVTLSVTTGTVTVVLTPGGGGVLGSGTGTVVLTGTASAINTMLQTSGSLTYTPPLNFNGAVTLTQTANDLGYTGSGGVLSDVDIVRINVTPVNDPPTAVDDTASAIIPVVFPPGISINVTANDTCLPDVGETLSIIGFSQGASGIVMQASPTTLTYIPSNPNFIGTDAFTYTISDGNGGTAWATVTITMSTAAVNSAPVNLLPVSLSAFEDTDFSLGGAGRGVSDADSGSNAISVTLSVATGVITVTTPPSGGGVTGSGTGTVVLTGTASAISATLGSGAGITYRAPLNFTGAVLLTMTTNDLGYTGAGGPQSDTDTATINVQAVNDPLTAVDDTATTNQDTPVTIAVLINDQAANVDVGEPLTITTVGPVANGVVAIGQVLTYTPNAGFSGNDVFTYTVTDGAYNATATVTVTVTPVAVTYRVYLPLVMNGGTGQPDLVGSFSVAPAGPLAGQPATVTVVITNQGGATAAPFWADFYINPSALPIASNMPWDQYCGLTPCHGLAWYVSGGLAAGQSVTLTSTFGSYYTANSCWDAPTADPPHCVLPPYYFVSGTQDLYLYVDSWNPGVSTGAVAESNEANNYAELHFVGPLAGAGPAAAGQAEPPPLIAWPTRPPTP